MNRRTLIITIGAFIFLVLMVVAIFTAVGGRKLTLHADPTIEKVTIDDKTMTFQQGMKIDYQHSTTITVAQDGYAAFKVTLDPTTDNINDYTIKLNKNTNAPVGSQNYELLKAAQSDVSFSNLLSSDSHLDVTVTGSKTFADGYKLYTIDSASGSAFVVVRKQGDTSNIVLGPGSDFDDADVARMPSDVAAYLRSIGIGGTTQ
jgi:hypothetical protein